MWENEVYPPKTHVVRNISFFRVFLSPAPVSLVALYKRLSTVASFDGLEVRISAL